MKKTLLVIVAAVALAVVPFVYAAPGHRGRDHAGFGLERLAKAQKELGLSDQQVDQIKTIFRSVREQNAQYRTEKRGAFGDVLNTLLKNPNDLATAQSILDQQAQNDRAMKMNLLAGASKALNVLTPEQRDKLAQLIAQHKQQRSQRQF